jgi:3-deoxy-manno-octulosonate cytidylyltransferase (CMP-KDO synthetase)
MSQNAQTSHSSYVVIPARLSSTRLRRKMLLRETGKSLIEHTYESARRATRPMGLCVATDSDEILSEVRAFGGQGRMTSPHCVSGTDRVAELARSPAFAGIDIVVNVQGDEPEISPEAIDRAIELLERDLDAVMATIISPIRERTKLHDPSCVKVVYLPDENGGGRAVYFSRAPVPYAREWNDDLLKAEPPHFYCHVGLYAYRRDFLLQLSEMPPSPLEQIENLEQLRVIEAGHKIPCAIIDESVVGIDTPSDYQAFVQRYRAAEAA